MTDTTHDAPGGPDQLTRADLASMTPDAIVAAHAAGHLDALQGVPADQIELVARARNLEPVTRAELAALRRIGRDDLAAGYAAHLDRITT